MATVFSGGSYINMTFTGTLKSDIMLNLDAQLFAAGWTRRGYLGGGVGIVGTCTVTIASPGVVTYNTHGLSANDVVILQVSAGGALPTGLSVNTRYFVRNPTTNTFELSTTSGGSSINTSGSQSGTITLNSESILLESATQTYVTNPIRVRIKDNRGTCVQVSIENTAGTIVGNSSTINGGHLLPGVAKVYQILATKYRLEIFTLGTSAAREFVMAGMLVVPSFLSGVTDHGYMLCNSSSDSNAGVQNSIQTSLTANGLGNLQFIWNATIRDLANDNNGYNGNPVPLIPNHIANHGMRWVNDALNAADVLLMSGIASNDEGKLRGQFYDMIFIAGQFTKDATDTFNSHTWQNLSNNLSTGGIWVATS